MEIYYPAHININCICNVVIRQFVWEDIRALQGNQPGGHVDGLVGLLVDHREENGTIDNVSTLPKIVCRLVQPFPPPIVLFKLLLPVVTQVPKTAK